MPWRRSGAAPWQVAVLDGYGLVLGGSHVVARDVQRAGEQLGLWQTKVILGVEGAGAEWLRRQKVPVEVLDASGSVAAYGRGWGRNPVAAVAGLPQVWCRVARALRGVDIVHVHDHRGLVFALPFVIFGRRPVVWHVHNAERVGRMGQALSWIGQRCSDVTIVPAAPVGSDLRPVAGVRTQVVPNAVELGAHMGDVVSGRVVTVARLHPSKGLHVLVEAVATICARGINIELLIVGGPAPGEAEYVEGLRQQAAAAGCVSFLGPLDDPGPVVASAQVYVQPSLSEPFGLAALEASAAGRPVIASDVGGLPSVVVDNETGVLVPPGDAAILAMTLVGLLEDRERADQLGQAGRRRAQQHFSLMAFAERLADVYGVATART